MPGEFVVMLSVYSEFWRRTAGEQMKPSLSMRLRDAAASVMSDDLITADPEILGGTPVFTGTRVPVKTLFDYLEHNYTLDEFLSCFPSVTREMACRVLERSETALLSKS